MIFSNEERDALKSLQHSLNHAPYPCMVSGKVWIDRLLSRLEKAENCLTDAENNLGVVNPLALNAWRESAGLPDTSL